MNKQTQYSAANPIRITPPLTITNVQITDHAGNPIRDIKFQIDERQGTIALANDPPLDADTVVKVSFTASFRPESPKATTKHLRGTLGELIKRGFNHG